MKMFPSANYLLVDPLTAGAEWTSAGLYLPETARELISRGIVLATGPKVWEISAGDIVHYDPHSATELAIDGATIFLLREREAIAKEALGGAQA